MKNKYLLLFTCQLYNLSSGAITETDEKMEVVPTNITNANINKNLIKEMGKNNKNLNPKEMESRTLMLLVITKILEDYLETNDTLKDIKEEYVQYKESTNDEYKVHQKLIQLIKQYLLGEKYANEQQIFSALKIYNMGAKLNFKFKIIKITIKNTEELDKIKELIKIQQNVNLDRDLYYSKVEDFMKNYKILPLALPYDELYFVDEYVGHVKIPQEYNEVQRFIKHHGFYIYGRESLPNGDNTYYILYNIEMGKKLSITEFKKQEAQKLFQILILQLLKQTNITINNEHPMNLLDREIAKILFSQNSETL